MHGQIVPAQQFPHRKPELFQFGGAFASFFGAGFGEYNERAGLDGDPCTGVKREWKRQNHREPTTAHAVPTVA